MSAVFPLVSKKQKPNFWCVRDFEDEVDEARSLKFELDDARARLLINNGMLILTDGFLKVNLIEAEYSLAICFLNAALAVPFKMLARQRLLSVNRATPQRDRIHLRPHIK